MNCRKNHNYTENVRANRIYYRTVMKYAYYYSRYQHSHVLQRVAQNVNHRRANVDVFFVAVRVVMMMRTLIVIIGNVV